MSGEYGQGLLCVYDSSRKCSNKTSNNFGVLAILLYLARRAVISCAGRRTQIFPRRSALRHRHQGGRPAGVSQPTVTGQLRQLESRYGVELFHRQGRGLRLSDAGHRLMPLVEKLVQQESEIEFRLRDASDLREGCLRVGATGPFYIMDTVRRYNQRYPAIELSVAIGNSQSMLQALHDYRIDVATSSVAMNNPNLYRRAIAADPLRIVVHRDHPLAARAPRPAWPIWRRTRCCCASPVR